jgi:hypothetical protein
MLSAFDQQRRLGRGRVAEATLVVHARFCLRALRIIQKSEDLVAYCTALKIAAIAHAIQKSDPD